MYRLASLFVLAIAPHAWGQTATGNIRGAVTDTSEGVIANVKIALTNINTGFTRELATNERGDFDAPSMPIGEYQIAAEYPGFQKKIVSGIGLQVDQTAVVRIVLEAGAVNQTVEVTASTPLRGGFQSNQYAHGSFSLV